MAVKLVRDRERDLPAIDLVVTVYVCGVLGGMTLWVLQVCVCVCVCVCVWYGMVWHSRV